MKYNTIVRYNDGSQKDTNNAGPRTITVHGDLKTGSVPSRSVSKDVHVKGKWSPLRHSILYEYLLEFGYTILVPPTSGSKVCSEKLALPTTKPTTSVSKSQLQAAFRTSRSPVVQNAIIEWNKFNKVVRTLTRSTEVYYITFDNSTHTFIHSEKKYDS